MSAPGAPLVQRLLTQAPTPETAVRAVSTVLSVVKGIVNAPLGMVMAALASAFNCSRFRSYNLATTRNCHAIEESSSYWMARSPGSTAAHDWVLTCQRLARKGKLAWRIVKRSEIRAAHMGSKLLQSVRRVGGQADNGCRHGSARECVPPRPHMSRAQTLLRQCRSHSEGSLTQTASPHQKITREDAYLNQSPEAPLRMLCL